MPVSYVVVSDAAGSDEAPESCHGGRANRNGRPEVAAGAAVEGADGGGGAVEATRFVGRRWWCVFAPLCCGCGDLVGISGFVGDTGGDDGDAVPVSAISAAAAAAYASVAALVAAAATSAEASCNRLVDDERACTLLS
jgi:hypothetical protein